MAVKTFSLCALCTRSPRPLRSKAFPTSRNKAPGLYRQPPERSRTEVKSFSLRPLRLFSASSAFKSFSRPLETKRWSLPQPAERSRMALKSFSLRPLRHSPRPLRSKAFPDPSRATNPPLPQAISDKPSATSDQRPDTSDQPQATSTQPSLGRCATIYRSAA
jgi:hypothetical protein